MELVLPDDLIPQLQVVLGFLLPLLAAIGVGIFMKAGSVKNITFAGLVAVLLGVVGTGLFTLHENGEKSNEIFSKQLEEKYDATSKRSFVNMSNALREKGEVSTTLTRDGLETDVFIKKVYDTDRTKMKLLITVYNEGALYPEATE